MHEEQLRRAQGRVAGVDDVEAGAGPIWQRNALHAVAVVEMASPVGHTREATKVDLVGAPCFERLVARGKAR